MCADDRSLCADDAVSLCADDSFAMCADDSFSMRADDALTVGGWHNSCTSGTRQMAYDGKEIGKCPKSLTGQFKSDCKFPCKWIPVIRQFFFVNVLQI